MNRTAGLRRAVFLDRDETIIEDMEFSVDPARIRLLPGALDAMRRFQEAGYLLIVITNQSGVARGVFDEKGLAVCHEHLREKLREEGVTITDVYYCPHYSEGSVERYAVACDCRKPAPGMLLHAAREHDIDLEQSWMIGDRPADVGAGRAAGCRTIRVLTGPPPEDGEAAPDFTVPDMAAAAEVILGD